jgi:transcriptional regulator with GAF, ATPase, and Fis domain
VLQYVLVKVKEVAPTETTVLIEGETGVGKELFARAIHQNSLRQNRPLVKVNCAALPANLIESELFGHEKGAFTGASTTRKGRFELADGGTLFLDEISELPLELQPKLLRVLQEQAFERLGGHHTISVDVRIIAATNKNVTQEMEAGRFREDLYHRLYVYPLSVPPLRQRKSDIPLLVQTFVAQFANTMGKQIDTIPQSTMDAFVKYAWPGNVRELQNVIERAVITTQGSRLRLAEKLHVREERSSTSSKLLSLEEVERKHILEVLDACKWRISGEQGAAVILGLHPNTLRFRMQKLGIKTKKG